VTGDGWVVTCDPGVDDAVALAVAAGRPDLDVTAVVAGAGNVDAATAWRNAAGVAVLAGLDVPVTMGSPTAVTGAPIHRAGTSHGADGLAGLAGRLPDVPPRRRDPGSPGGPGGRGRPPPPGAHGQVLATGPLTDVALALRAGRTVGRVVWLGGSLVGARGTGREEAEFNAAADPAAVGDVLSDVPDVRIVPVDVSGRVVLSAGDRVRWAVGPPLARFCAQLVTARHGPRGGPLHDPVAVVAAVAPDLFGWEPVRLRCLTDRAGPPGILVADRRAPRPSLMAVDVDAAAVADAIVTAVLGTGG
jgi:inosine-uridine nucleoside N-ribohydrolase